MFRVTPHTENARHQALSVWMRCISSARQGLLSGLLLRNLN